MKTQALIIVMLFACSFGVAQQGISNNWLSGYYSWGGSLQPKPYQFFYLVAQLLLLIALI